MVLHATRIVLTTLFLMELGATTVWGQARNTARLYGRITDQQGAAIAGASANIVQVDTGIVHTAQSNQTGEFEFSAIPVGEYSLTVQKPGFEKVDERNILLQVNDNRRVDVSLVIGEVSTTIAVEAASAAV